VAGESIHLVDSADTTASSVQRLLRLAGLASTSAPPAPRVRLLATDGAERFGRVGSLFLARGIVPGDVELVDL
jgi:glutamate racemase